MSQILSNKENQSNSIYSDVCQNEEELEQVLRHSKKLKKQSRNMHKDKDIKRLDSSHIDLHSKDNLNDKNDIKIEFKEDKSKNEKCSLSLEYKSCYEEKICENKFGNLNIDREIKTLENIENVNNFEHFDLSTINSNNNSNNNHFLEENTDFEINSFFEINFNNNINKNAEFEYKKKSKKMNDQNMKISNSVYSFYNNFNNEDLSSNNSNNKLTTFNNKTFTSLFTSNKYFFESNQKNNINNNCSFNKNSMKYSKDLNNNNIPEKEMSINKIKFEGINKDDIDIEYLSSKLKKIPIKSKNIKNDNYKYIKSLYELQDFMAEGSGINVIKIDDEGKYLSIGFKNGVIKIYEIMNYSYQNYKIIYDKNNLKEYFHFINETPFKTLSSHTNEIIDLFWLFSSNVFLISSSLDVVILWNIKPQNNNSCVVKKFHHTDIISCMATNTIYQNMFATGCVDKFIHLWTINKNLLEQSSSYYNTNKINNNILSKNKSNECELKEFFVNEEIISINFLQEGDKIAIGTNNGKVLIYSIIPDINFEYSFNCKNRFGKHVTNINFFSSSTCLISSLDSRIRYVNIRDGRIIHKYKGHKNEKSKIKIGLDLCNDIVISGSENGYCYLWNVFGEDDSVIKNYSYEYYKPFSSKDIINESQIVSEKCYVNYFQKILKITNKIMIDSIIINGNDKGRIKIMLNINDLY